MFSYQYLKNIIQYLLYFEFIIIFLLKKHVRTIFYIKKKFDPTFIKAKANDVVCMYVTKSYLKPHMILPHISYSSI
jgi:hypothetical protein